MHKATSSAQGHFIFRRTLPQEATCMHKATSSFGARCHKGQRACTRPLHLSAHPATRGNVHAHLHVALTLAAPVSWLPSKAVDQKGQWGSTTHARRPNLSTALDQVHAARHSSAILACSCCGLPLASTIADLQPQRLDSQDYHP